jgi:hypothetical protein
MICCYADELKEGFYPYVEEVGAAEPVPGGFSRWLSSRMVQGVTAGTLMAHATTRLVHLWVPGWCTGARMLPHRTCCASNLYGHKRGNNIAL